MNDFPTAEESFFNEGKEEGRKEGLEEGKWKALASLVKDGLLDVQTAASRLKISVDEFLDRMQKT